MKTIHVGLAVFVAAIGCGAEGYFADRGYAQRQRCFSSCTTPVFPFPR